MKRFTLSLTVLFAATLLLTACGKKKTAVTFENRGNSADEQAAPQEEARAEEAPAEQAEPAGGDASAAEASGGISVSRITPEGKAFAITLNNSIVIHQVEVKSGQYGKFLGLPERRSQDGKFWDYVYIQRGDGTKLAEQLDANKAEEAPAGLEVTSAKVKMMSKPDDKMKAFVEFELNGGAVKLYSWAIREGSKGTYISGPSEKVGNDYQDLVHAANKEFYEKLKTAALAEYKNQGGVVN